MLTFSVGLLILSLAVGLLGVMLDEVYSWGAKVAAAGVIMLCVALTCLAGCVFYYGVQP